MPTQIKVTQIDETTGEFKDDPQFYPSIALAAVAVRETYPALYARLRKRNRTLANGYQIELAVTEINSRHNHLRFQIRSLKDGSLSYCRSYAEITAITNLDAEIVSQAFSGTTSVRTFTDYRIYRIG